jgi:hypothetical protein
VAAILKGRGGGDDGAADPDVGGDGTNDPGFES